MRFYNYIYEARESRDKKFRKEALEIYKQTYDGLKEKQDNLDDILEDDNISGEEVKVLDFGDIQRDYDLLGVFRSIRVRDFTFVVGEELSTDPQISLPIIENSMEDIPENFKRYKKAILHELIHYLDFKRSEENISSSEEYYNIPGEFNAYYQEAIEDIRDDVEKRRLKINNFKEFLRTVKRNYFDRDFIDNLNKKYTRKLDKRLHDLYKDIINEK